MAVPNLNRAADQVQRGMRKGLGMPPSPTIATMTPTMSPHAATQAPTLITQAPMIKYNKRGNSNGENSTNSQPAVWEA